MDHARTEPFPTRHEAVKLILDTMQLAVFARRATILELVNGKSDDSWPGKSTTGLTEWEARDAMGWLYAHGRARVVEVRKGEEVWEVVFPGEKRNPVTTNRRPGPQKRPARSSS